MKICHSGIYKRKKKKKSHSGINNMIFKSITKVISNENWEMWAAKVNKNLKAICFGNNFQNFFLREK